MTLLTQFPLQEWWAAYNDPALWRTINLAGAQDAAARFEDLMHSAHRFRGHLQRVVLQFAVGITDHHVAWLRQFGATVVDLNLDACHGVSDAQLQHLLPAMPNLQSLSLYWHPTVSDATLFLISAFNTNLQRLVLSACQRVSDGAVATVATACHRLKHLDLTRCLGVSHTACQAIGSHCHELETLLLYANAGIDDASLIALSQLQVYMMIAEM